VLKSEKDACSATASAPDAGATSSSPRKAASIPSSATTQPRPPASTTPAFFRTGFWLTVFAKATFASSKAAAWTTSKQVFFLAVFSALAAARRATVKIVPSAGFITALYAASTPSCSAWAHSRPLQISSPFSFREMPRNNRDRITPELPRAPRSIAFAAISAAFSKVGSATPRRSAAAVLMVMDILVPVSPSGTGNTFSSFNFCLLISIAAAAFSISLRKSPPLIVCFNVRTSLLYFPMVMESMNTCTARTSVPVHLCTI